MEKLVAAPRLRTRSEHCRSLCGGIECAGGHRAHRRQLLRTGTKMAIEFLDCLTKRT
jgi:hypothetical protein